MTFEIVGAGAIGLLLAAKLASAGEQVRVWTRTEEQAERINRQGLCLGTEGAPPATVAEHVAAECWSQENVKLAAEGRRPEFILLTVKQGALTRDFCETLSVLQGGSSSLICFQNGMGHLELIGNWIEKKFLYAAVTTEGAKRLDNRSVIYSGQGETSVGTTDGNDANHEAKLEKLVKCLRYAGFKTFVSKNISKEMYRKLLVNAAINPLTALWRIPNGGLIANDRRRGIMSALIKEGMAVYEACGIPFDADIAEQIVGVCQATAGNISSMLADVLKKGPTEIDYINGYLVHMARKASVAAPTHEMIVQLVQGINETG